jgi:TonB family protein
MFKVFTHRRKRSLSTPRIVAASLGAHLLLLNAAILFSHTRPDPVKAEPELTVTEFPIAPRVDPPAPPPPAAAPEDVPRPVAGRTLQLHAPTTVPDRIPDPDPSAQPVSDSMYSGIGRVGDVIGDPAPTPAPPTGATTGDPAPPSYGGDYVYETAEEMPEMSNVRDVARLLERNYPPVLRDAGVGARVTLEMVVDETGRVRPGSVRVVSATHDEFTEPSVRVAERFRFRPARVGDRAVPVLVTLPIDWKPGQR